MFGRRESKTERNYSEILENVKVVAPEQTPITRVLTAQEEEPLTIRQQARENLEKDLYL